jgi:prepilin-type N-terminal cleavage/methylation domain-containing protein
MKKSPAKKSGFTLIEIVIVLAIAALIIVIVFVAVQGAQRSRRDTASRNVASQVLAALVSCASNNSGQVPGSTTTSCDSYITGAGGSGVLGAAKPTSSATLPTGGTTDCPATAVATNVTSGSATGFVSAYYWNEASSSAVCISSKF